MNRKSVGSHITKIRTGSLLVLGAAVILQLSAQSETPLAHWSFEESIGGTTFVDVSGHEYNATCSKELALKDGMKGMALESVVSGYTFHIANSQTAFSTPSFTVEALVKHYGINGAFPTVFCAQSYPGSADGGYGLSLNDQGRIRFSMVGIGGSDWMLCEGATVLAANTWYHLAIAFDGTALKSYVNGVLERSVVRNAGYKASGKIVSIGCQEDASGVTRNWFNGMIDELMVFDQALSGETIAAKVASYGLTPPTPSVPKLLAHWSFDSTDKSASYFDVSGNGHTAKTNQFSITDGVSGAALDCRSNDFEVRVPNSVPDFVVDQFTIESWIYSYIDLTNPGSFYNYKGIFNFARVGMEGSGYAGGYSIQISDKGKLFTSMSAPQSGSWIYTEGLQVLNPRTWYHIAATYDKTTLRLFLNGVQVSQIAAPDGFFMPANTPAAVIGAQFQVTDQATDAGRIRTRFNGKIDELKLYNYALDAATVKSSYESVKPVEEPPFEINLGMKTTYALPGDTVVMPVYIANHEDFTVSSLQLTLHYDQSKLTLLSVTKDSGIVKNIELFDWNGATPGSSPIAMAGTTVKLGYGEGELFRCLFVVAPSAGGGDTCRVDLADVVIDEINKLVVSTTQSGRIIVSSQSIMYGDVTGNKQVTVVDAQQILKYVVGALPLPDAVCCPNFTTAVADVSGNGTITSYDAALVFQYSLGMIPDFPVGAYSGRPLAKRSTAPSDQKAQLSFTVNSSYQQDALVYDLVGSNLCGFYAGEFAIICEASTELLSKSTVTTDVRGATLSSKFYAAENLLRVAVSSNDDIDSDGPVAIVRIVLPPAQQAAPVFTVRTALINEGAIMTDFSSDALTGLLTQQGAALSAMPAFRIVGNQLAISRESRTPATVTVWDLRGRVVARQTINAGSVLIDIGKFGRGAYVVRLVDGRSSTTGRIMLMDR